jgi:hypothetical protein
LQKQSLAEENFTKASQNTIPFWSSKGCESQPDIKEPIELKNFTTHQKKTNKFTDYFSPTNFQSPTFKLIARAWDTDKIKIVMDVRNNDAGLADTTQYV